MSTDYGSSSTADATSANLIRSGTVVDRRLTSVGAQVRVVYPDRGVTSAWLPVGQSGSAGTVFHFCPRIGDNVTVLHFPTGIEMGTVIGTNCTPNNPSFTPRSLNATAIQFDDGAYIEYDPDVGCLSIPGVGTIYVNANGQIVIIAGGDIDVTTQANCNLTVTGNLVANVSGDMTATDSGNATLNASAITLNAQTTTITGVLKVDTIMGNMAPFPTANPKVLNQDGSGNGS